MREIRIISIPFIHAESFQYFLVLRCPLHAVDYRYSVPLYSENPLYFAIHFYEEKQTHGRKKCGKFKINLMLVKFNSWKAATCSQANWVNSKIEHFI